MISPNFGGKIGSSLIGDSGASGRIRWKITALGAPSKAGRPVASLTLYSEVLVARLAEIVDEGGVDAVEGGTFLVVLGCVLTLL